MWSGKKSRKHPCLAPGTRLARWPCGWERVGGWEGGWDCEGVRRGAWAARRLARCPPPPPPLFSTGTGARQFVPPLPRQREAPRSMMSTRLRGPEKPAAGLLTAQRCLSRSRSCECQQTSTPHFSVSFRSPAQTWMEHFQNISPSPGWMPEHPRPPRLAVGALERGCSRRGRPSDAGQWAQQLKAAWERGTWRACRVLTGRLSLTASPARRPVASIGPFGSTWSAILARASCTKNKLCRQEARVGEGRRGGERGLEQTSAVTAWRSKRRVADHCPGRDGKKLRVCVSGDQKNSNRTKC